MFCQYCGQQLSDHAQFCNRCGANLVNTAPMPSAPQAPVNPAPVQRAPQAPVNPAPVQRAPQAPVAPAPAPQVNTAPTPTKQPKKKKPLFIILAIVAGLLVIGLAFALLNAFVFNSADKLQGQLVNQLWCSEPMEFVAVDGSNRTLTAYTIVFHADGTATLTTYMAVCPAYEELNESDLEFYEEKIVSWSIASDRSLVLDGIRYTHKPLMGSGQSSDWYIEDGQLHLDRTYYSGWTYSYAY